MEAEHSGSKDRKFPTMTESTDDEKVLDSSPFGRDRKDVDNIPSSANLRGLPCACSSSADPMVQMEVEVGAPT